MPASHPDPADWKAPQPATAVTFEMPENACDCHTHIHGDIGDFPYFAGRVYTPMTAYPEEMAALHQKLGITRVVIVTPSVYGADNRASIWGMKARGEAARGVAVIDEHTTDDDIAAMHKDGMRGVRLNLATSGVADPAVGRARFEAMAARMAGFGWHVQIYTSLDMVVALKDLILKSPVPVVLDHFAGAQAALGVDQAGFKDLLDLLESGRAWVKISGAYRSSASRPDFPDTAPLARAMIAANADRIVWGTDWPHPDSHAKAGVTAFDLRAFQDIDDGMLLNQLPIWAPDAATRRKILTDNPAKLYGF